MCAQRDDNRKEAQDADPEQARQHYDRRARHSIALHAGSGQGEAQLAFAILQLADAVRAAAPPEITGSSITHCNGCGYPIGDCMCPRPPRGGF